MMQIRNPRKESRRNRKLTKGKRIKSRSVGNGGRRRREKEEKRVTNVSDDEEGGGERGLMLNGHVNVRRFHSRGLIYSKKQESGKGSFMSANGSSSSSFTSSSSSYVFLSFFAIPTKLNFQRSSAISTPHTNKQTRQYLDGHPCICVAHFHQAHNKFKNYFTIIFLQNILFK